MAQIPEFLPRAVMFAVCSPHILMTSFSFAWHIGLVSEDSPPREEGWTRSGRGGRSQASYRCERPPRLRHLGGLRRNFPDAAATPPHEEGNASIRAVRGYNSYRVENHFR
jgi:hypothetical protein